MGIEEAKERVTRKTQELYITLIRTFGVISITIPFVLFFVNEFVYEVSLILMMALGVLLILFSMVWAYMVRKHGKQSQYVED